MDGTLLNSKNEVSREFFELFKKLKEHNIHFAAASGRQYFSIVDKLNPIKNDISIIAENGGITKSGELELGSAFLSNESVGEVISSLRKLDKTEMVLCGKNRAYVESQNERFLNFFTNFYKSYQRVDNLMTVDDDICKVACYYPYDSEEYIQEALKDLAEEIHWKISGEYWIDIAHRDSHKGNAVHQLQEHLKVSPEETLVFGDYENDLEMMQQAGLSIAMENAHPSILKIAHHRTKSNDDLGVETILQELIQQRKVF